MRIYLILVVSSGVVKDRLASHMVLSCRVPGLGGDSLILSLALQSVMLLPPPTRLVGGSDWLTASAGLSRRDQAVALSLGNAAHCSSWNRKWSEDDSWFPRKPAGKCLCLEIKARHTFQISSVNQELFVCDGFTSDLQLV